MKQKILASLFTVAAINFSAPSMASTITNLDLTNASPFGGFDWSANGTALSTPIEGPLEVGDIFTTYYFADAVAIAKAGGGTFNTPNMIDSAPGGSFGTGEYQYTAVFQVTEEVISVTDLGGGATFARFAATEGTWNIYYDYAGVSGGGTVGDQVTGAGFDDGIRILGGIITPGNVGNFTTEPDPNNGGAIGGDGNFNFTGTVNYTNSAYIAPDQTDSNGTATLQFGWKTTNWTGPTGTPWGDEVLADAIIFQADGNQSFRITTTEVPEPGMLALLGLGIFGLLTVTRRKNGLVV